MRLNVEKLINTSRLTHENLARLDSILERYMVENEILAIEIDLKKKQCMVLEPIANAERQFWVEEWLRGELPTRRLQKKLKERFQWVLYVSFFDFLKKVETWLRKRGS